ncbi:MAG: hypothetical protein CSA81_01905 [Acidobacteria bacterium]|nr:MAG: hypothetical protein CSA81_01905 [Acidobacteriota bacterium]
MSYWYQEKTHRKSSENTLINKNKRPAISTLAFLALLGLVIWFIVKYILHYKEEIKNFEWNIPPHLLMISLLLVFTGYAIIAIAWGTMEYLITNHKPHWLQAYRVYIIALLGKYLPGKVWGIAGRGYLSTTDKTKRVQIGLAAIFETLWFNTIGIMVFALFFPFALTKWEIDPALRNTAFIGILLVITVSYPGIYFPMINKLLKILSQPALPCIPKWRDLTFVSISYVIVYLLWASALLVLISPYTSLSWTDAVAVFALFALAWVIGFAVLVAPSGIGVRDAILIAGLVSIFPGIPETTFFITIVFRLIFTAAEIIGFFLALLIKKTTVTN